MSEKQQYTQAFLNQRKMAMVLPLFIWPVALVLFLLAGGGSKSEAVEINKNGSGINTKVPEGGKKGIVTGKLDAYNKARDDEERRKKMTSLDEYSFPDDTSSVINGSATNSSIAVRKPINDPAVTELSGKVNSFYEKPSTTDRAKQEKIDKLLQLMENKQSTAGLSDEEYVNRELLKNPYTKLIEKQMAMGDSSIKPPVEKRAVMEVASNKHDVVVSALRPIQDTTKRTKVVTGNSFYSTGMHPASKTGNTISAVIHQAQAVIDGSSVKLRLLNDITINGKFVPKNTSVWGLASLKSERLSLNITSIRYNKDIMPVNLTVYDNDGMEGLSAPGSVARDAGKAALAQGAQGVGGGNYSVSVAQSVGQQMAMEAANAGLGAAKSLVSRKVKQVVVYVKANYTVYLK